MFQKKVTIVIIACAQLLYFEAIQAMVCATSKPLPNMYMRECRLMELFSEGKSFFTKLYPNNPDPLCPTRARLPVDVQGEICKYVFDDIIPARIAHGDTDDTVSATLKRTDYPYGLKRRTIEEFLKRESSYDLNRMRLPYNITLLLEMILERNIDAIKILIGVGVDVNVKAANGMTPLSLAAKLGYHEIVQILLDAGLPIAAEKGNAKAVALLLRAGAHVNAKTPSGRFSGATPLLIAAEKGHAEVVRILIEASAETETTCNFGLTPLHIAAQNGHPHVVKRLLAAGAKMECTWLDTTPLLIAVMYGHPAVVERLLEAGADRRVADGDRSLMQIATDEANVGIQAQPFIEIISLLKQYEQAELAAVSAAETASLTTKREKRSARRAELEITPAKRSASTQNISDANSDTGETEYTEAPQSSYDN